MVQVEIEQASRNLSQLIARAVSGEEIVLAQAGKPLVKLVLIEAAKPEVFCEAEETDNSLMEDMLSAFEEEIH
ncbi:MAG: type II toxin-antitoxin system prevent-host-death family antitoxin [Pleurocapsa sp. MO_226.B13]|nr:type II toxin-antitoxin system prevent-host-death family antitoxin [Pleurocapsa sp. MO_226.B13]